MVEVQPPDFLGANCYTFQDFRQTFGGVVCVEGVTTTSDLAVTAVGGASLNVNVAAGTAWVEGDLNGSSGMYFVTNDASVTVTIAANGAGSSRIDLIVASVYDSQYIGAADSWAIEVVQGVAGAGVPAVPSSTRSGYLILGRVTVPASGGTPSVVSNPADVAQTCGASDSASPYVALQTTAGTTCTTNVVTKIVYGTTTHIDANYFTVASSVVTVTETGLYDCYLSDSFDVAGSGLHTFAISKNGLATFVAFAFGADSAGFYGASPVALNVPLTAGDTLQAAAKQQSGGNKDTFGGQFVVRKVG